MLNLSSNGDLTLGGQLRVDGKFEKSGGVTTGHGELIVGPDGELFLNGYAVVNVALSNEGKLLINDFDNVLNGALTTGVGSELVLDAEPSSARLRIAAGFTNRGTIRLTGNERHIARLFVTSGTLINAPGATIFCVQGDLTAQIENQGTLEVEDGVIFNEGKTFNSSAGSIRTNLSFGRSLQILGGTTVLGSGTIFVGEIIMSGTLNLVSDFTLTSQLTVGVFGQPTTVNGSGTLINRGILRLDDATVNAPVDNGPGGRLVVLATSTINGALTTAAASGLEIGQGSTSTPTTLRVFSEITNNGSITLAGAANLDVLFGALVNAPGGVISSEQDGRKVLRAALLDNQGVLNVERSLELQQDIQNRNSGTIVVDAGQTLTVNGGSLEQTPSGTVNLKFASLSLFGKLIVSGESRLDGALRSELVNGFIPLTGDSFEVMTYGSRVGEYATVDGGTVDYSATYGANSLVLTVVAPITALAFDLAGDYNGDGTVDGADFTVYRDMLGRFVPAFSSADGNGNGRVDQGDYEVWKANFGNALSAPSAGSSTASTAAASAGADRLALSSVEPLVKAEAFDLALLDPAMTLPTAPFITSKRMGSIHSKLFPARETLRDRLLLLAGPLNWTAGEKRHEELLRTRPSLDGLRVVDDLFAELGIEQVAPKAAVAIRRHAR